MLFETFEPISNRARRNCERGRFDLAGAARAAPRPWPGKKCQDCAGRAAVVTEVKMITARIIEIHRPLNKSQAEQPDVEIKIALGIGGDGRDMMQAANFFLHRDQLLSGLPISANAVIALAAARIAPISITPR